MASYGGGTIHGDLLRGSIAEAKTLTVDRLKRVLRHENLASGGLKNELQMRVIARLDLENLFRRNDIDGLRRMKDTIRNQQPQPHSYSPITPDHQLYNLSNPWQPYPHHPPAQSMSPPFHHSPTPRLPTIAPPAMPPSGYTSSRITFKNSPFYTIQRPLTSVHELKAREQTRDTVRLTIKLDDALAQRFQNEPSCKAFVFCAAEPPESVWKPVDIAFPHHAELKCNQEELKVSLKGLKNRPGSTRPVDITPLLRKKAGFPNSLEMVYALTNKAIPPTQKFYLVVNLVQKNEISSLIESLKRGKYLSKERVISDMQARLDDDDIVAVSTNMSLKDPVQMTRIETPCRAVSCKHNQCFDAAAFLALQEQAPTWTCPICNKPAPYDNLVFDQYVQNILKSTSHDTEQVTVEPDGTWHLIKNEEDNRSFSNGNSFTTRQASDDDEDDSIEIVELDTTRHSSTFQTNETTPGSIRTPPIGSRDTSFPPPRPPSGSFHGSNSQTNLQAQGQQQSQSKKRPREEVIDLTLSDDEDDDQPPVSRYKRPPPPPASFVSDSNRPGGFVPFRFHLPQAGMSAPNLATSGLAGMDSSSPSNMSSWNFTGINGYNGYDNTNL